MASGHRQNLIRARIQEFEAETLSPHAAQSAKSRGRERRERECDIRTAFQRDRDRILHSKAFRRLRGKTQVFLSPEGDHYRTRLTHTLETAQISRTVGRALKLNEDLVEAIALGHDLGHTPFGHAGEAVLARLNPDGFHHSEQSVRVVEVLEQQGRGLNLTIEVREGIRRHSKGLGKLSEARAASPSSTLEAEVVRICDCVAYVNHDLDDAIRAGFVKPGEVPGEVRRVLGESFPRRIDALVHDIVDSSYGKPNVRMSEPVEGALEELRLFLKKQVYKSPKLLEPFHRSEMLLASLYDFYCQHPEEIPEEERAGASLPQRVCDHLAGMTDRFALNQFQRHLVPQPWGDEE